MRALTEGIELDTDMDTKDPRHCKVMIAHYHRREMPGFVKAWTIELVRATRKED